MSDHQELVKTMMTDFIYKQPAYSFFSCKLLTHSIHGHLEEEEISIDSS